VYPTKGLSTQLLVGWKAARGRRARGDIHANKSGIEADFRIVVQKRFVLGVRGENDFFRLKAKNRNVPESACLTRGGDEGPLRKEVIVFHEAHGIGKKRKISLPAEKR